MSWLRCLKLPRQDNLVCVGGGGRGEEPSTPIVCSRPHPAEGVQQSCTSSFVMPGRAATPQLFFLHRRVQVCLAGVLEEHQYGAVAAKRPSLSLTGLQERKSFATRLLRHAPKPSSRSTISHRWALAFFCFSTHAHLPQPTLVGPAPSTTL